MDFTNAEQGSGIPRCVLPLPFLPRLAASILVVKDEALVRVLAAGMFGDAGFRVLEAANVTRRSNSSMLIPTCNCFLQT
jgi:hypothetical protein